jgi:tripartite-type tricarboxylate transporter receptor subunit TctC
MINRRVLLQRLLSGLAAAVGLSAERLPVAAQSYPSRPITLIVPFAAGGFNDVIVRIVAQHMSQTLGQSIIVENDAGAGGTTASARAAQAPADGYTLLAGSMGTHGAAPAQYANLKYDPAKDFAPIGLTAEAPAVIVTRKDFPANTLQEFVAYVRTNAAKVNEAHAGVGSQMHTYCTLLQALMGTKTARIAYRGGAPAINDLVAGQVDFGCVSVNTVVSQIQGGTVKALAIASPERAEVIKDVPTTTEAGLPEFLVSGWNAIFAPRALPPDVQAKLSAALSQALEDPLTSKRLLEIGCFIPQSAERTPQALQARVEREVARWTAVLKRN